MLYNLSPAPGAFKIPISPFKILQNLTLKKPPTLVQHRVSQNNRNLVFTESLQKMLVAKSLSSLGWGYCNVTGLRLLELYSEVAYKLTFLPVDGGLQRSHHSLTHPSAVASRWPSSSLSRPAGSHGRPRVRQSMVTRRPKWLRTPYSQTQLLPWLAGLPALFCPLCPAIRLCSLSVRPQFLPQLRCLHGNKPWHTIS